MSQFFTENTKRVEDSSIVALESLDPSAPAAATPTIEDTLKSAHSYGPSLLLKVAGILFASAGVGAIAKTVHGAIAARDHAAKAVRGYNEFKTLSNGSLTGVLKSLTFPTRVYVDEALSTDPTTSKIAKVGVGIYASMIMATLHLENFVAGSQSTVLDRLSSVATESLTDYVDAEDVLAQEDDALDELAAMKYMEFKTGEYQRQNSELIKQNTDLKKAAEGKRAEAKPLSNSDVSIGGPDIMPAGMMYNVTLTNPNDPSQSTIVPILVQARPFILSGHALAYMVEDAAPLPTHLQLLQVKAGEKRFVRDFLLQLKRIDKQAAASRSDKDGGFSAYLRDVAKKDRFKLGSILMAGAGRSVTRNAASNILIISQDTLDIIKSETGVDFENKNTRDESMRNTYNMMVFVVSQTYNKVRLYLNGIDDVGAYNTDDFLSSKNSNTDMKTLLAFMTQGRAPRF